MTIMSAAVLSGPAPAALQPIPQSASVAVPGTASTRRAPPMPLATDWPNGRILMIGPQGVIEFSLQRTLRDAGYRLVGPVGTPAEVRQLINHRPTDGAIVDLDLDPWTARAVVRLLDAAGIPIVFLLNPLKPELTESYRDRPLVRKPYTGADLLAAVRRALAPGVDEEGIRYRTSPPISWPRIFPQL
jgi:hypothetical protein